jgi:hypothetical protein
MVDWIVCFFLSMNSLLMCLSRDKHMRRELILQRQTHEKRAHTQETNTWEENSYSRDKHMRREFILKKKQTIQSTIQETFISNLQVKLKLIMG